MNRADTADHSEKTESCNSTVTGGEREGQNQCTNFDINYEADSMQENSMNVV